MCQYCSITAWKLKAKSQTELTSRLTQSLKTLCQKSKWQKSSGGWSSREKHSHYQDHCIPGHPFPTMIHWLLETLRLAPLKMLLLLDDSFRSSFILVRETPGSNYPPSWCDYTLHFPMHCGKIWVHYIGHNSHMTFGADYGTHTAQHNCTIIIHCWWVILVSASQPTLTSNRLN